MHIHCSTGMYLSLYSCVYILPLECICHCTDAYTFCHWNVFVTVQMHIHFATGMYLSLYSCVYILPLECICHCTVAYTFCQSVQLWNTTATTTIPGCSHQATEDFFFFFFFNNAQARIDHSSFHESILIHCYDETHRTKV